MLHPFAEDTKDLTISELTDKISDPSKSILELVIPSTILQIQTFIDYYKQEIAIKTEQERKEQQNPTKWQFRS